MLELTIKDLILVPIFLILFVVLFRFLNKRVNKNNGLGRYFMLGFSVKIIFGIVFGLFSILVIPGDTEMYYTAGIDFKNIILEDPGNVHFITSDAKEFGEYYESRRLRPENYGYVSAASNLVAVKFVALFSLFSLNNYLVISMFFSMFSFFGLWCMFRTFYRLYPAFHKQIFFIFFFIPSLLFWGSGVLKDTLCIGFLGIGLYNAYLFFFEKKYKIHLLVACLASFYLLYITKPYIAYAFLPCGLLWYIIRAFQHEKNILARIAWVIIPLTAILIYIFSGNLEEVIEEHSAETIADNILSVQENYRKTTPDDGALIEFGEIEPTPAGILRLVPKALVATLFRPFLWEAGKITSFLAALEGAFLFVFTLFVFFKKGPLKCLNTILSDNNIFFCFIFSIVFAIAIGLNCFNLGTLVRYKIPCLPFYLLSFFLILKKQKA